MDGEWMKPTRGKKARIDEPGDIIMHTVFSTEEYIPKF